MCHKNSLLCNMVKAFCILKKLLEFNKTFCLMVELPYQPIIFVKSPLLIGDINLKWNLLQSREATVK